MLKQTDSDSRRVGIGNENREVTCVESYGFQKRVLESERQFRVKQHVDLVFTTFYGYLVGSCYCLPLTIFT